MINMIVHSIKKGAVKKVPKKGRTQPSEWYLEAFFFFGTIFVS